MFLYLVYLIFIITVAMAAGGVILSARLQKRYDHEFSSPLLYYQVFIYTFGFYGIWGQVLLRAFLPAYVSGEVLERFCDMALLLGLPFAIFAWMMLLQFSSAVSGSRRNNWFAFWFLFINITIIILIGYISGRVESVKPVYLIKYYFILANLIFTTVAAGQIFYSGSEGLAPDRKARKNIAAGLFMAMVIQSLILILFISQAYLAVLFILAYFAGNTFLPLYMSYGMTQTYVTPDPVAGYTFEEFCRKYDVSPRESEIIREICKGLSNKEISENLFISLQTVKDHTHRIYIKTNVRSRAQLMNLVRQISDKQ